MTDTHLSPLPETSENAPAKEKRQTPRWVFMLFSILFFVASLCSFFFAVFTTAIVSTLYPKFTFAEYTWIFLLFLPIPITSIVIGFLFRARGFRCKKNLIAGFIVAAFLTLYGSVFFLYSGDYAHDTAPLLRVEALLETDLPEPYSVTTWGQTEATEKSPRDYTSKITFGTEEEKQLLALLGKDERWLTKLPTSLVGLLNSIYTASAADYILLYNTDTGEFNQLPDADGVYSFLCITYRSDNNTLEIEEYQVAFVK